jgi:hypothetical protein
MVAACFAFGEAKSMFNIKGLALGRAFGGWFDALYFD